VFDLGMMRKRSASAKGSVRSEKEKGAAGPTTRRRTFQRRGHGRGGVAVVRGTTDSKEERGKSRERGFCEGRKECSQYYKRGTLKGRSGARWAKGGGGRKMLRGEFFKSGEDLGSRKGKGRN